MQRNILKKNQSTIICDLIKLFWTELGFDTLWVEDYQVSAFYGLLEGLIRVFMYAL